MASDHDLAYLAFHLGFLGREHLLDAGAEWDSNRERPFARLLVEKGYIDASEEKALVRLAALMKQDRGFGLGRGIAAVPEDAEVRGLLEALAAAGADRGDMETVMRWTPAEKAQRIPLLQLRGESDSAMDTIDAAECESPKTHGQAASLRGTSGEKYEFLGELGRGGLGRVMEAVDNDFGRSVAVKMMLSGQQGVAVERFLQEGRVAGSLPHPNIVPVYEIGVFRQKGGDAPFFTMAKIAGRDLGRVLGAVWAGEGDSRAVFSRHRLLRVFQDVCMAVEYAHEHGVIHRDLKPSNVMIGDFGEVYVVDWGLAKVLGQKDGQSVPRIEHPDGGERSAVSGEKKETAPQTADRSPLTAQEASSLTVAGTILGTPAYMPPEQAEGRIDEVDDRSDIYSLGAILYEVLTFHPPFEGATHTTVLGKVVRGELVAPSARAAESRLEHESLDAGTAADSEGRAGGPPALTPLRSPVGDGFPDDVPPELEAIVLKAMSRDRASRHSSARELHDDVQSFLEGEKQRRRDRDQARAKVAEGIVLVERMAGTRAELAKISDAIGEMAQGMKPFWPVERKQEYWAAIEKARALHRSIIDLFTEAGSCFQAALEFERGNRAARAALADLYWEQFLREEEAGDETEMRRNEQLVRQYNDGQYDDRLKGDGSLSISTRYFPCACMRDGRLVYSQEFSGERSAVGGESDDALLTADRSPLTAPQCGLMGYHPVSGRSLDGRKGTEGVPWLEPVEPVLLKAHGRNCATLPLAGADVWLFRYEERNKVLVPVFPENVLSGQRSAVSGEGEEIQDGSGEKFQRIDRMAEGEETCSEGLPGDKGIPQRGGVRPDGAVEKGIGFGSREHCGRMGTTAQGRVPELPVDSAGLDSGSSDSLRNRNGSGIYGGEWTGRSGESLRGNKENAAGDASQDAGLTTVHSPLTAHRLPLSKIIDHLYNHESPFRPSEGLYLGKTPIPRFTLPMGSYLLVIAGSGSDERVKGEGARVDPADASASLQPSTLDPVGGGFAPVRVPVFIGRNAAESVDVAMYRESEVPAGFVQVPGGKFILQGDRNNPYSGPKETGFADDFFVGEFPVTCGEYLEFVNELAAVDPEDAARRIPRATERAGFYWPRTADGTYAIPTAGWMAKADPERKSAAAKIAQCRLDWEEDWPVLSVSWEDAMAYAKWFSQKSGVLATIPHEKMREKAARGPDGRIFTFGNFFDETFANIAWSHEDGPRPMPVRSCPVDESPYGARGLSANSADWCLNDSSRGTRRPVRGGSWIGNRMRARSTHMGGNPQTYVFEGNGFRLAVLPRL